MANPIHQEVTFDAPPAQIYETLIDARKHTALSGGAAAEISREVGGPWSAFGGQIHGRNLELVPGRRIVQAWRSKDWAEGVYSIVRFELMPEGDRTRLIFDHSGFPESEETHLSEGWKNMYWDPMTKYLG